jgi:micrococcal nuclease
MLWHEIKQRMSFFIRCPLLFALLVSPSFAQKSFVGKVVSVTDGDTIRVMRGGVSVPVRLYGIDSPEKRQPFYAKAKKITGDLAFSKMVTVNVRTTDRWKRSVAEVVLPDGRMLNHEIVRTGFAWWFRQHAPKDATLARLEHEARRERRGLWVDSHPVAPWDWRRKESSVRKAATANR